MHCQSFFAWYNDEHRHSGIALHTAANPDRFVRKPPAPPKLSEVSWINKPDQTEATAQ